MKTLQILLIFSFLFTISCSNKENIESKGKKIMTEEEYRLTLEQQKVNDTISKKQDTTTIIEKPVNKKQKQLTDISLSNKLNIQVARESEISIKILGKNGCYTNKQIDSIISSNINKYNFKSRTEIEQLIISLTGSINCWDMMSPGLQIEIEMADEKPTTILEQKKQEKDTTVINQPKKKQAPKANLPQKKSSPKSIKPKVYNKTKTTICFVPIGNCKTCEEFAKKNGIINIADFCTINGFQKSSPLKKGTFLGVPCTPK